ncbi:nuclear RNA export factor 2 isoform X1 [Oryctolagus cuniculus]|uniref:nuclear RNA export factor 2 isoform X1 n=1 Tax=Oryctolagus cuniculus TaxID=9986 RepID=UPI0022319B79|nr:nuclear RNA export factor 2 isoform X1 [Oryctolagus cuniculus]XP_051683403.1 nuclear RNA export factor 2 isoform X1 [Oryctolagus cuniculus]XP_051683404.1 nuclear RNA export factor 2 isoform X1 [Oryctolagus cuniculus]
MYSVQEKYGMYQIGECGAVSTLNQGMKKDWDSSHGYLCQENLHYEHNEYKPSPSYHQENNRIIAIVNTQQDLQLECTPYSMECKKRKKKCNRDKVHGELCRYKKRPNRDMGEEKQDGTLPCWIKVTFHYINNEAQFFVQDAITESALKECRLLPEEMEQLKLTLNKRYDAYTESLDLQRLYYDPDLVGHDIDMILNQRHCMAAILHIIEKQFPELFCLNLRNNKLYQLDDLSDIIGKAPKIKILNLSDNELKMALELQKLKELKLEELWLKGNPLCSTFSDHAAYVSLILDCFPNLLRLDGRELYPRAVTEIVLMKPCKDSYEGPELLKNLILHFLQQYYFIYDYGDRRTLISVYHEKACFSLSTAFHSMDPDPSAFYGYVKNNRNMKDIKDSYLRRKLLKHRNHTIVDALSMLPRTQHDFNSFSIDMWFHTDTMISFAVNGLFRGESNSQNLMFAFTRTFIVIPSMNSMLCILNDQLFVRNVNPVNVHTVFTIPGSIPCSSCTPTVSQLQHELEQAFSSLSGMKFEWCRKCLEENGWNYTRAAQVFLILQMQGKIPKEAFKQIT